MAAVTLLQTPRPRDYTNKEQFSVLNHHTDRLCSDRSYLYDRLPTVSPIHVSPIPVSPISVRRFPVRRFPFRRFPSCRFRFRRNSDSNSNPCLTLMIGLRWVPKTLMIGSIYLVIAIRQNEIRQNEIRRDEIRRNEIRRNEIRRSEIRRNEIRRNERTPLELLPFVKELCKSAYTEASFS